MTSAPNRVEETMNLSDTKQQFSKVVNRVAKGEASVIVEKSGLPVAAIVSMDEYRQLREPEPELQGETLYRMVEQGLISDTDLTDDDHLDIAVYIVRMGRLNEKAKRIVEKQVELRQRNGENLSEQQIRDEYVNAMRESRAQYLAATSWSG